MSGAIRFSSPIKMKLEGQREKLLSAYKILYGLNQFNMAFLNIKVNGYSFINTKLWPLYGITCLYFILF